MYLFKNNIPKPGGVMYLLCDRYDDEFIYGWGPILSKIPDANTAETIRAHIAPTLTVPLPRKGFELIEFSEDGVISIQKVGRVDRMSAIDTPDYKTIINTLFSLWESLAEAGEIRISERFSQHYNGLKATVKELNESKPVEEMTCSYQILQPPQTLSELQAVRKTVVDLMNNPHSDEGMLKRLGERLKAIDSKINELTR